MHPPGTPACDPGKLRLMEDAEDWQPRTGTSQSRSFRKLARLTGTDGRKSLLLPAAVGCCGSRWHRAAAVAVLCCLCVGHVWVVPGVPSSARGVGEAGRGARSSTLCAVWGRAAAD